MTSNHSPTFPSLHLSHNSFSNLSVTSSKSQLILQPSRPFTYVIAHSQTFPSLYLHHSSFPNPSIASPMSQLIFQPFFRFSYVTGSSLTSPGKPSMIYTDYCSERLKQRYQITITVILQLVKCYNLMWHILCSTYFDQLMHMIKVGFLFATRKMVRSWLLHEIFFSRQHTLSRYYHTSV